MYWYTFIGSGRSVTTSSNGIFIDLSPPVIQTLYHLDLPFSDTEPVRYQGTNSTIAIYLETADNETDVSTSLVIVDYRMDMF